MQKAIIRTEFLDYDIIARGFVISGDVHNFAYVFPDLDESEIPTDQEEVEKIEEFLKEELVSSVYSPELKF